MAHNVSRKRVGAKKVQVHDVQHVCVFYDENTYAGHPNRGGIWNFDDGEIAVAHRVKTIDYQTPDWQAIGAHNFSQMPYGQTSGIMINRSFDNGKTWPESEKHWIWNNDRPLGEILDWLQPVDPGEREQINLSDPDAIMHFSPAGEHLKWPLGGCDIDDHPSLDPDKTFHLGRRKSYFMPAFCLRSRDRGRTWESHATLIDGPSWAPEGGFLTVNLGHVHLDNGVLGIVGTTNNRNVTCFYASYDNGLSWEFVSEIAHGATPDHSHGYTYSGVHRLPDGRLLCSMHRMPENHPYVVFSEDEGMNWSAPRPIISPGTYACPLTGPEPDHAPGDRSGPRYRSPCARVTRDGRIIIVFARREYPARGGRGILGVVSDDLGETWSDEFVLRGDAYTWDCGYPVMTELENGRFFVAYYFTSKDGDEPVPEYAVVRHIAGTFFQLD
jgi:hypothetical protein